MQANGTMAKEKAIRRSGTKSEALSLACKFILDTLEAENLAFSSRVVSLGDHGKERLLKLVSDYEKNNCSRSFMGKKYFKKRAVRKGVTPYTRPYIWLLSVGLNIEDLEKSLVKYRTRYYATLQNIFGTSNREDIILSERHTPWFGAPSKKLKEHCLNAAGFQAVQRLLCVISNLFPMDSCPMLPDLVAILLYYMPEHFVLAAVASMIKRPEHYFFMGRQERKQVVARTCVELANKHNRNESTTKAK